MAVAAKGGNSRSEATRSGRSSRSRAPSGSARSASVKAPRIAVSASASARENDRPTSPAWPSPTAASPHPALNRASRIAAPSAAPSASANTTSNSNSVVSIAVLPHDASRCLSQQRARVPGQVARRAPHRHPAADAAATGGAGVDRAECEPRGMGAAPLRRLDRPSRRLQRAQGGFDVLVGVASALGREAFVAKLSIDNVSGRRRQPVSCRGPRARAGARPAAAPKRLAL